MMDWSTVFKIVGSVFFSTVGAATIIISVAKKLAASIANGVAEKIKMDYQSKMDQMLETYKAELDNKGHISKARFDTEFSVHKELCRSFNQMISAVHWLFPAGLDRAPATGKWEEICNERYRTAQEKYNDAASTLGGNAPFINDDLYRKYHGIMELAAHQINNYSFSEPLTIEKSSPSIRKIEEKGYKRTQEIDEKWKELLDELRQYFNSLTDE